MLETALGLLGLQGNTEQLYTSVPTSEEDDEIAALAQQLKQLPHLTRLYLKERRALYGSRKNIALRKKAKAMGYEITTLMFPERAPKRRRRHS